MMITLLGSAWLLCFAPLPPQAQTGRVEVPISTDRPGFLFAPTLVPPGRVQLEAGLPSLNLAHDGGDQLRVWSLPFAVRYGWSERLELRASLPTWTEVRADSGPGVTDDQGFADSELGAKLALAPLADGPLALLGTLRLPTGADGFSTQELGVSAYLLHGRDVGAGNWLQAMLGVSHVPVDGAEDATNGALAALVSRALAERWSAYVECAAFPGLSHAAGQAYAGCALLWTPRDALQLDLSADFGLDEDATDMVVALGLSWCF